MRTITLCLSLLLLAGAVPRSQAVSKEPAKRYVENLTVDLTPVLKWRAHPKGPRPLPNWGNITGKIVGTNACGWVVEAKIDGEGKAKQVILKNPPSEDANRFQSLQAQLHELKQEHKRLEAESKKTPHDRVVKTRHGQRTVKNPEKAEVAEAKADVKVVEKRIAETEKALAEYPTQKGHYLVDCLAMKTALVFEGMVIYDRGRPAAR